MNRIRCAEEKDIPRLITLLTQVLNIHADGRPDLFIANTTKYTPEELKYMLGDEENPIFVYVDEKDYVLGYVFCNLQVTKGAHNMNDHRTLFIDDLCVDEAYRHQMIGHALFAYIENYAKQFGCYHITLNVWTANQNAVKFYESLGLEPMKYVMEKKIGD